MTKVDQTIISLSTLTIPLLSLLITVQSFPVNPVPEEELAININSYNRTEVRNRSTVHSEENPNTLERTKMKSIHCFLLFLGCVEPFSSINNTFNLNITQDEGLDLDSVSNSNSNSTTTTDSDSNFQDEDYANRKLMIFFYALGAMGALVTLIFCYFFIARFCPPSFDNENETNVTQEEEAPQPRGDSESPLDVDLSVGGN